MSDNSYFASKEATATADILLRRANSWYNQLYNNGYLIKVKDLWMAYHNASGGNATSHRISFSGEQGEMINLTVNHLRNIGQHMLEMITANRPAIQVRATNADFKSIAQTRLAESLLEYYLREKRLEKNLKLAVEYAIALGSGFIKMEWNSTSGEIYEINEETGTPIYEGDVKFTNLSPFDVVFDMSKETTYEHDWVLCRSFKNKYDLAAKFPELKERIVGLATKSDSYKYRLDIMIYDETSDIPVYEFYHNKTESMPDGRYLMFLESDLVLMDTALPYRSLPVYRISPSNILGTPYGYTPLFDLMPLQEAHNALTGIVLTNQNAFGVQNIFVNKNADIVMKSLEGGLNIVEGNMKPEPLNLTNTPIEIFNFRNGIEKEMETLSGISSVVRGNPEASLKSGAALALVQSQSLQFMSGLQQQYVELIEDVGTGLLNMLRDFAAVPRLATIAGKNNKAFFQEFFTGDDLSQVNRVVVEMGNPLANTTAGKLEIAKEMMQYGIIKNPEDFISVMETGRLDVMTDETYRELLNIRQENEMMADGKPVQALIIDKHSLHISHHKTMLDDAAVRMGPEADAILNHIMEHLNLLRTGDPGLLALVGEKSLGPQGGSPPPPMPPPDINQSQAPSPQQGPQGAPPGPGDMPNLPNMPQVPAGNLQNPALQEASMGNVKQ